MPYRKYKELLIIIPAYNEEANIPKVLDDIEKYNVKEIADILVINDGSTDNTGEIVRTRKYRLVTQAFHLGYGNGLQIGYKYAVRRGYKYVIQIDADGQHDICNIKKMYDELRSPDSSGRLPDILIGSRFLEDSQSFYINHAKMLVIKLFRRIVRRVTGLEITDPTSGLQGLSRPAFLYYSQYNHFNSRYTDANMIIQMNLLGFNIRETGVIMHEREGGTSMHSGMRPLVYMFWMLISIASVLYRIKILKIR